MDNKILVKAIIKTDKSVISRLYINGHFECFTLENVDRGLKKEMPVSILQKMKVAGKTAIPEGSYKVSTSFSSRFQKVLPILIDVPAFEGIRIHPGNYPEDTEGCLLLGSGISKDMVTNSKVTFEAFFTKLKKILESGTVEITFDRTIS